MSFRRALGVVLVPLILLPIILGIVTFMFVQNNIEDMKKEALRNMARSSGISLKNYVDAQSREMLMIAKMTRITECLKESLQTTLSEETRTWCQSALYDWISSDPNYRVAMLLDDNGIVLSSSDGGHYGMDLSGNPAYIGAKDSDDIGVSKATKSFFHPDEDAIHLACQVVTENGRGVLVLEATLAFYDLLVENVTLGQTGASYLVDEDGYLFCHSSLEMRDARAQIAAAGLDDLVSNYISGAIPKNGTMVYESDGILRLMGYYIIEDYNWAFVTRQYYSEIRQPATVLFRSFTIIYAAVIVVTFILGVLFLRTFSKPIQNLRNVFHQAATEGTYLTCGIVGKNEFSELAVGYNKMIARLIKKEDELHTNYLLLKEEKHKTEYIALHDPVTSIGNRAAFEQTMQKLLDEGLSGGVLYLDLDSFKNINDVFGHYTGDLCLKEVAKRLSRPELKMELVSRTGGDEFFAVKLGTGSDITRLAEWILSAMLEPFVFGSITLNITVSIGISMFPHDGQSTLELMRNADVALYAAKESGKNQYYIYQPELSRKIARHMDILQVLEHALDPLEACILYQPEISATNEKIVTLEALIRINSKKLGFISPAEFIPIAESSGKIIALGSWCLKQSCIFATELRERNIPIEYISVNVSTIQLEQFDFVDMVLNILGETGLPPHCLQLEITESVFMDQSGENIQKLSILRSSGITVALDDFGTGYSSLQYLAELPLDVLKIDKFFIDDIVTNEKKRGITRAISEMAHILGLKVVAEGVETAEQRDLLKSMGCDIMQGYFYYKPLAAQEIMGLEYDL